MIEQAKRLKWYKRAGSQLCLLCFLLLNVPLTVTAQEAYLGNRVSLSFGTISPLNEEREQTFPIEVESQASVSAFQFTVQFNPYDYELVKAEILELEGFQHWVRTLSDGVIQFEAQAIKGVTLPAGSYTLGSLRLKNKRAGKSLFLISKSAFEDADGEALESSQAVQMNVEVSEADWQKVRREVEKEANRAKPYLRTEEGDINETKPTEAQQSLQEEKQKSELSEQEAQAIAKQAEEIERLEMERLKKAAERRVLLLKLVGTGSLLILTLFFIVILLSKKQKRPVKRVRRPKEDDHEKG